MLRCLFLIDERTKKQDFSGSILYTQIRQEG